MQTRTRDEGCMPVLLMKTSREFLACPSLRTDCAPNSRPVFLSQKPHRPSWRRRGFSRQPEDRHNTLDLASKVVCQKGLAAPFGIPCTTDKKVCPASVLNTPFYRLSSAYRPTANHYCFALSRRRCRTRCTRLYDA